MSAYESTFTVTGNPSAVLQTVELKNPAASGKALRVLRIGVNAEATFQTWEACRYNGHATHGIGPDAPSTGDIHKRNSADGASVASIFYSSNQDSFDWSSVTETYCHPETIDASDAGDDAEIIFCKYIDQVDALVINQGESMSIKIPAGELDYTIGILWKEV
jgi:hypothetical protein